MRILAKFNAKELLGIVTLIHTYIQTYIYIYIYLSIYEPSHMDKVVQQEEGSNARVKRNCKLSSSNWGM